MAEGAFSTELAIRGGTLILQLAFSVLRRDGRPFGISVFGKDITKRKRAEAAIAASLHEKEILLRELYHRTKNNMNVIISMLRLQSEEIDDARVREAFTETEDRILSMALVHEKLYESKDLSHINLKDYLRDLAGQLRDNYSLSPQRALVETRLADVYVALDAAISCGLIVNELISNALKHAFPDGRSGRILVELSEDSGSIRLVVEDNGVGLPPGFSPERDGHLGLELVNALATGRLGASLAFSTQGGLRCELRFQRDSGA